MRTRLAPEHRPVTGMACRCSAPDSVRSAAALSTAVPTPVAPAVTSRARVHLSEREVEVLVAWLHLETKEAVGRRLHISVGTVNTHLTRVRAKFAAAGRPAPTKAALLARAVQDGHVDLDTF